MRFITYFNILISTLFQALSFRETATETAAEPAAEYESGERLRSFYWAINFHYFEYKSERPILFSDGAVRRFGALDSTAEGLGKSIFAQAAAVSH